MGFKLEEGRKLAGKFELREELDSGAFADVWRAHDTVRSEDVALKLSHTRSFGPATLREYFEREWNVLQTIDDAGGHPNIMDYIDGGEHDDTWYTAVEFVDGQEIHNWAEQNGTVTDTDRLRDIGIELCDALSFLHEIEIVYRDLKPDNVMRDEQDQLKVIDFNTSRVMDPDTEFNTKFRGPFKAPEISGGDTDTGPWTDVYSIGKFLFYLMTTNVEDQHELDPRIFGYQVDDYLAEITKRATAKDPAHRYRNARLLKRALETRDPNPPSRARIELMQRDEHFDIQPGDTIGRQGGQAAITIQDEERYISAVHAQLDTEPNGQWYIEDKSLNGTWVNKAHDDEFQRVLNEQGRDRLIDEGRDPSDVGSHPTRIELDDGDIFALVHPDYNIWFRFQSGVQ